MLCTDPSVGEQLRPHLFGLLALSGASYPPSGVHVARADSVVIVALAEFCLTRQLVWFIHERKMVVHMTDDIKELLGMTNSTAASSSAAPTGKSTCGMRTGTSCSPAIARRLGVWIGAKMRSASLRRGVMMGV